MGVITVVTGSIILVLTTFVFTIVMVGLPLLFALDLAIDTFDREVYPTVKITLGSTVGSPSPSVCRDGGGQYVLFQGSAEEGPDEIPTWRPNSGGTPEAGVPNGNPGDGSGEGNGGGLRSRFRRFIADNGSRLFDRLLNRVDPSCTRVIDFSADLPQEERMAPLPDGLSRHLFQLLQVNDVTYHLEIQRVYVYDRDYWVITGTLRQCDPSDFASGTSPRTQTITGPMVPELLYREYNVRIYTGSGRSSGNRIGRYVRDFSAWFGLPVTPSYGQLSPSLKSQALPLELALPYNVNYDVQPRLRYNRGVPVPGMVDYKNR